MGFFYVNFYNNLLTPSAGFVIIVIKDVTIL